MEGYEKAPLEGLVYKLHTRSSGRAPVGSILIGTEEYFVMIRQKTKIPSFLLCRCGILDDCTLPQRKPKRAK